MSGLDFPDDGRGLVVVDWDQDGDLDFWISNRTAPALRFMRNDSPHTYHWVSLRLSGNGITCNRDAIGARVEVLLPQNRGLPKSVRELRAGEGFLSQSSKALHFGLGESTNIEGVKVRWPDGSEETFSGIEIDARYAIQQGSGRAVRIPSGARNLALQSRSPGQRTLGANRSMRLNAPPLVVPLQYQDERGRLREIPLGRGTNILVNLWASWCHPCVKELSEFTKQADRLRQASITVYALNMDPYSGNKLTLDAERLLQDMTFPFPQGHPTRTSVAILEAIRMTLLPASGELVIPTSYLIDSRGRLSTIYKGLVDVDTLIADAKGRSGNGLLSGRSIEHPQLARTDHMRLMRLYSGLAKRMTHRRLVDQATFYYKELQRIAPPRADTHVVLGRLYMDHDRRKEATEQFTLALGISPEDQDALFQRGLAYSEALQLNKAIADFLRLTQLNPEHASAHSNLGSSYARMEMWDKAKAAYMRALEIAPEMAHARENLGKLRKLRPE